MAVVGASGVVFGLAGATIADMALNFESLGRPVRNQHSSPGGIDRRVHACQLQLQ